MKHTAGGAPTSPSTPNPPRPDSPPVGGAHHLRSPETPTTMACYVDPLARTVATNAVARRVGARHDHHWCHLWADTEEELHTMAAAVGMKRAWFQDHPILPHYDLVPPRRAAAVRLGAVEATRRDLALFMRRRREQATSK